MPGEVRRLKLTSCQLATASPLTRRMRSPRSMPAAAADDPGSTPPTRAGMAVMLGTAIPTMKREAKRMTARMTFIAGPAT